MPKANLTFGHIGINVRDLAGALPFYAEHLQLAHLHSGRELDPVLTRPANGGEVKVAKLVFPCTEAQVRLLEYPEGPRIDAAHKNRGTAHLAFYTDDMDELWESLEGVGTELCSTRLVPIVGGVFDGGKAIYCVGPGGLRVEFLEGRAYLDGSLRSEDRLITNQRANEASHFGLHVRDRDKSLRFWRDALQMETVAEWLEGTEPTREVIGYPDAELFMSILRLPGTQSFFEVIEYRHVDSQESDNSLGNVGACYLAFLTDNLEETVQAAIDGGAVPYAAIYADAEGRRCAWLREPDGFCLQFIEK